MKWLKQIFGVKPEDDTQENVDAFLKQRKFANATKTNELVVSANNVNTSEIKKHSKSSLNKLTKVQLFDYAEKNSLKVKKSGTKAALVNEIWSQQR